MPEPLKTSTYEEREKRLRELEIYIGEFCGALQQAEQKELTLREGGTEQIKVLYYRFADELLRPAIASRTIQHFKIAATTELVILMASPLVLADPEREKYYNARLALYVALRFVIEWNHELPAEQCYQVIAKDETVKAVLDEHFKWLYLLNPNYYNPIFLDAQNWRLFFLLLREKIKAL